MSRPVSYTHLDVYKRQILNLERESARLENRAGQLKNEETQILDKMWENYELTPTPCLLYTSRCV